MHADKSAAVAAPCGGRIVHVTSGVHRFSYKGGIRLDALTGAAAGVGYDPVVGPGDYGSPRQRLCNERGLNSPFISPNTTNYYLDVFRCGEEPCVHIVFTLDYVPTALPTHGGY
jgi:hypothetical protein